MRKLEKLKSTYIDACLEIAWEDDRVHPQWNMTGTATGRFSCTSSKHNSHMLHKRGPALQTIPTPKGEEDWEINPRKWFIVPEGKLMFVFDLSQAEINMLAVMSQCPVLLQTVNAGTDMHTETAKVLFAGWLGDDAEKRGWAKAVNFGTMYGMGENSLAKRIQVTVEKAKEIIAQYYNTYYGVKRLKEEVSDLVARQGYVKTFLGRRRTPVLASLPPRITVTPSDPSYPVAKRQEELWRQLFVAHLKKSGFDTSSSTDEIESRAVRQAFNCIIQGSVAELLNYGLIELVRRGWTVIGQVHDEVLIEIDDNEEDIERLQEDISELFNVTVQGVTFRTDVKVGKSWAIGKE